MPKDKRDHGGGLDAAISAYGGTREDWIDLSTGINPNPFPISEIPDYVWHTLPDEKNMQGLLDAAREFWSVPDNAHIVAANGVSAIIANLPSLAPRTAVDILGPTYNEFAASYLAQGVNIAANGKIQIRVHPNNPDGRLFSRSEIIQNHQSLSVIDESFCDTCPENSLVELASNPNTIILKGTGKFWGLAGMRLGFAITSPEIADTLKSLLGPWNVSGPALYIGQCAIRDQDWITNTRVNLENMTQNLDAVLNANQTHVLGGTDLFRLCETKNAKSIQHHLCTHKILTRIFPYSDTWVRFGLPANENELLRLQTALSEMK